MRSPDAQTGVHEKRDGHVFVLFHLLLRQLDRRDRLPGRQACVLQFGQQLRGPAPARQDGEVGFKVATVRSEDAANVGALRVRGTEQESFGFGGDELDAERTGEVDRADDGVTRRGPAADVVPVCMRELWRLTVNYSRRAMTEPDARAD